MWTVPLPQWYLRQSITPYVRPGANHRVLNISWLLRFASGPQLSKESSLWSRFTLPVLLPVAVLEDWLGPGPVRLSPLRFTLFLSFPVFGALSSVFHCIASDTFLASSNTSNSSTSDVGAPAGYVLWNSWLHLAGRLIKIKIYASFGGVRVTSRSFLNLVLRVYMPPFIL